MADHRLAGISAEAATKLSDYVGLLLRWNARVNLTAIREEQEVLSRHIVEGVLAAQRVPPEAKSLLDFGSGAGIPGIPVAICCPALAVTLAEARQKKAAFLREAVRVLGLGAEVHADRVDAMDPERRFDVVTMRAVEHMKAVQPEAWARVGPGGTLMLLMGEAGAAGVAAAADGITWERELVSGSERRVILMGQRLY